MRDYPQQICIRHDRAVFVDRDGTINVDTGYPHRLESLELLPGAAEGLVILSDLPVQVILVTNQSGIARNYFDVAAMSAFNEELVRRVAQTGARIDAIYYCPHHPAALCPCAKPRPGMLREAASDFGIDLGRSWMIGDKRADVNAARSAGVGSILVRTGNAGQERDAPSAVPDLEVADLRAAAKEITTRLR